MIYEYLRKKSGYKGNLNQFVNEAITFLFKSTGKVFKIGLLEDEIYMG